MSRSCRGVERRILRHLHECKTRTQLPQIHAQFLRYNLHHSSQILSHFLAVCGSLRQMKYANSVFLQLQNPSILLFNPMIKGQMRERSCVSWNTMISCLAQSGRDGDALNLFHEMLEDGGFNPDDATMVTMLPVCACLGEDGVGNWIHSYVKSSLLFQDFISVGNALVDFYCKRGDLDTVFMVFDEMPLKNVVSWNSLISGLAFNGKGERGVALFDEMIHNGLCPSDSTFVGVLACCVHAGFVQRGRVLFDQMVSNHHLKLKQEHYGCMVDLLGRNGFVDEAHELIVSMTIKPNAALWGALLSACRIHGNMELAECATKELKS